MDIDAVREKSLARYKQERDWFALLRDATKLLPGEEGRLQEKLLTILLDSKETVVDCVENEKPFIAGYFVYLNRDRLLPTREQLDRARVVATRYQEQFGEKMRILYAIPDYYEGRPKACMSGWGSIFLTVAPDGVALPCQAARQLPGMEFPSVREKSVEWIWRHSPAFNHFRGFDWMKEPCRSCPEREKDFGGCRCQAYLLTGDAANADPVCDKSPAHDVVVAATNRAGGQEERTAKVEFVYRNAKNSKSIALGPKG